MKPARRALHQHLILFENRFLEFFTVFPVTGFLVLWPLVILLVAYIAGYYAPTWWAPVLFGLGWFGWTVVEYVLHRFVFHLEPKTRLLQQFIFLIHGNHHAAPNDPLRNLMPPIVSLPLGGLIWAFCAYVMGPQGNWFFLGFVTGYMVYDLVHYCCHQYPMKDGFLRKLKVHHMHHHFHREGGNFAITGVIWDKLLLTQIVSQKAKS
jgi:sterol desaturase/sphingolipid hydroxylase (fatty acid hydroxylase superfamily)